MAEYLGWFSCGITSAVACKLASLKYPVRLVYIEIDSAHPDNERFIADCERWIGQSIERIRSDKYKDQFDVVEKTGYVNGVGGAACTKQLKKSVREKYESSHNFSGQIFGFEFELKEINRAIRFKEQYPKTNPIFPLIEQRMTKKACAGLLLRNGIQLPKMYELGFHNNNCIGCVKGGKGYWNKIREHFPEHFNRMAIAERTAGHSCINGTFLDELHPNDGRHDPPILPECGASCEIEFADLIEPEAREIFFGQTKQLSLF